MTAQQRTPSELPDDLERVLRDQSIVVPQDAAVFELIGKWADVHSDTPPCRCSRCRARGTVPMDTEG